MPELVLASTSVYRRALLSRLGVTFRCVAPPVDEEALKRVPVSPAVLAERLARAKAESLAAQESGSVILGGDQLVALEGQILGKPGSASRAVEQLLRLAGRSHELFTAVAVVYQGRVVMHTDLTTLWMRPLDHAAAERYVEADRPFDCAGSYKIEERGISLFDRIESSDQTAITGLPLIAVAKILRGFGFAIP